MIDIDKDYKFGLASVSYEVFRAKVSQKKKFLELPCAFDTEASSFIDAYDGLRVGLCYIWQAGVGDVIVYSRYLDTFKRFFEDIDMMCRGMGVKLIIYVHFFKYDFAFIRKMLEWTDVFMRENRYPLFAVSGNLEFRDSLALAGGKGLAYIGDHLRTPLPKLVGDLDYNKIRTPETPMTAQELMYCQRDIEVLQAYIREKMEDEGTLETVPLTNTGYVRRYVKKACFQKYEKYMELMDGLTLDPDAFKLCEQAFGGGSVGPNIRKVGRIYHNVGSYDIKSAYPYAMVTQKFPMSMPIPVESEQFFRDLNANRLAGKCWMAVVEMFDVVPTGTNYYPISESRCLETLLTKCASGRVMTAVYVRLAITNLDWEIIKSFYTFSCVRFSRCRVYDAGYLPLPIIRSVIHFFDRKTTLDGVKGSEEEYMVAKNMLNSCYGMMAEKPVRDQFSYSDHVFNKITPDYVKAVLDYNEKRSRFLYYAWAPFVTAHVRKKLADGIKCVGNDFLYCDTDCVKMENPDRYAGWFEEENRKAHNQMIQLAKQLRIPADEMIPSDPKGEKKILGTWELEAVYDEFKTIGAKRYMYRVGSNYGFTAAGVNKKQTKQFIIDSANRLAKNPLDLFDDELYVPPEVAGRTKSWFIDDERVGTVVDCYGVERHYRSPSGVYVEPSDYSFSITDEITETVKWFLQNGSCNESEI